jgi:branched-chain amino acid transport system ATP-binding protein
MKAFRGEPSIFASARPEDRRAELEVKTLKLKFGGITALNNIDLTVRTGELVAIIGPNGAGKTSLLNCITGYYKPQEGQIFFNGEDVTHLSTHHLTKIGIGRTYQNIELFPGMSVLSNMLLARHVHCKFMVSGIIREQQTKRLFKFYSLEMSQARVPKAVGKCEQKRA